MNTIYSKALTHESGLEIAIIGASGRFPKAKTIEKFWENLKNGVESISFFSHEELLSLGIAPVVLNTPNYVKARGVLEDKELFDAAFFGFNPREAEITDPQHRIFLECAWEALENAGYNSETYRGLIGMYAGTSLNSYMLKRCSNVNFMNSVDGLQLLIGNDKDFLTTRVSYKLNLKGTSINVQTACSTSLVAVHLACRSLLSGECHMALAGGVSISETQGYFYREGGVGSPDGHCRAFDAKAQGTVGGDGVGIVVLKRLKDALADGDTIHAVIKGSATNNDGSFKVSYTAPGIDSQARVIRTAQVVSEVEPETITYIESHGTGTDLGDPIEIAALTQAFGTNNHLKGFCAIGSVKTNIGHLDAAAGVTSLIKTVLALKHKQIPPSLHFEQPNPKIDFANSPFYVNTTLSEWKANGTPRRAGVSSFGIGGTNAHVILEEAPVVKASSPSRSRQLLMLSAKTDSALETATANLANYLQQHLDLNLADVTYTLQVGRRTFEHRRTVICHSIEDAVTALQDPKQVLTNIQETQDRQVAFMFPGLGTHYVNMGIELYQSEPTFRREVDRCCELLKAHLGLDLRDVLYPHRNSENVASPLPLHDSVSTNLDLRKMLGRSSELADVETLPATSLLNQTYLAQPAIFVVEYALAQLWIEWGIRPVAMIGYSIGEYVAACLAEVLSLEQALTLVAKRAQLIQELPNGAMLAVPVSEKEIQPLLNESLSLSAINGSSLCVVAGTTAAVEELEQQLTQKGLVCRRLQTTHAFHSVMMDAAAPALRDLVKTFNLKPPKIPYLSNVTGVWISSDEATDPNYWVKHLCEPVQFASGIQQLWEKQNPILLEVGPGQTLCSLALQCRENEEKVNRLVLPCLRHSYDPQSDMALLLSTLGQLWLSGVQINWSGFYAHERRHRLPLPTYPFERQRYWVEAQQNISDVNLNEALQQRLDIKDWFYIPSWKRSVLPVSLESKRLIAEKHCWLVFIDTCGIGTQIIEKLKCENQNVIAVKIGKQFSQVSEWEYTINPQNRDDYNVLLKAIHVLGKIPTIIVHLWNVTADEHIPLGLENLEKAQDIGFWCLLFLTQALGERNIDNSTQISVVSNNMQQLLDEEWLCPEKATILGPCKVIPQEYSNITCRSIDIKLPQSNTTQRQQLIDYLLIELTASTSDQVIAYRGNQRWVQCFERLPIESQDISTTRLRKGGVYLITGGLGGIGLAIAEYLVKTVQAKIVLIGRSGLPPKAEWEQWLLSHQEEDLLSTKIKKVLVLEELGAEVLVLTADVANFEQMQEAVNQVRDRFGKIHGVIHAAGVPGGGLIQVKTTELAASVLKPKVNGTLILDAVLQDVNLDFMVLFSSHSAILGGLGHVDYCAANAFLDAFAHYNFYQRQIPTISINWDAWQWDAWENSFLSFAPTIQAEVKQARSKYGITFKEGVDAFSRILSQTLPQQVVSTSNLAASIEKHKVFALPVFQEISDKFYQFKQTYPRPVLGTAYVAPSDEFEQKIADIWQELLGVKQVGVHDNFFNLGGHSLLAIQLVSRLREDFQVELSLRHVFGSPTISELALIVEDLILGELEELTEGETKDHISVGFNQEQAPKKIEQQRYKLPNNLEIFYQTKAEADYFYEDIFKNRVYLKHGITLRDRACIFDVGANIGLFTLFVNQYCNNPTVYAFEPVPDLFEILRLNTALHSVNVNLFNLGLSNETKTATFTFYPNSSGMSSFYSDKEEEKEVLKAIMLNQLQIGMTGMDRVMEYADELLEERFKEQQLTCQLKNISEIMSENDIEGIDLLKIDVQKSELDVIKGIQKTDWSKIKQIIIEVHDIQGRLNEITNLLISQNYHVVSEQEDLYKGSLIHNIYAIRK